MTIFTYSQARQNFSALLTKARREGSVQIRRRDGTVFSLSPLKKPHRSPLDVKGIRTRAKTKDIIAAIRESRDR
jgi:antitoxin (DNA-binding transcriptional repressor) of toxin-antitoxin stability system